MRVLPRGCQIAWSGTAWGHAVLPQGWGRVFLCGFWVIKHARLVRSVSLSWSSEHGGQHRGGLACVAMASAS